MDSGSLALIGVAILGLLGTIYTVVGNRKSSKDQAKVGVGANTISEFEANIRAFDLRARNAEERSDNAEEKANLLSERIDKLEEKDKERERQLRRTLLVVQKWFKELSAAWPNDQPMPLPPDDDLGLLGIDVPNKPKET